MPMATYRPPLPVMRSVPLLEVDESLGDAIDLTASLEFRNSLAGCFRTFTW